MARSKPKTTKRQTPSLPQKAPTWTPFVEVHVPPDIAHTRGQCFLNSLYEVWLRPLPRPMGSWLSIRRLDGAPEHDFRNLQRLKNELAGEETEAVELYPAESRLVDMANQCHLWCLPPNVRFPFGLPARAVSEEEVGGHKQRPWPTDQRPADLMTGVAQQAAAFYAQQRAPVVALSSGTVKLV